MQHSQRVKVGVAGGAGYTGGELLRILVNHPHVDLVFVHSRSNAGQPLYKVHADLVGDTSLLFSDELQDDVDVLFLCVGHGEALAFLEANHIPGTVKIIDLSQDFRLAPQTTADGRTFTYGLPECHRDHIRRAANIANPGCFATAIQLGLLPLAQAGVLGDVYTTGITGSTGAGQKMQPTSHFSWRANNIQAYKTLDHQHIHEIMQTLHGLQPGAPVVNFIPWRGDFTRGIYVSSCLDCSLPAGEVFELYEAFYAAHPFTHVCRQMIDLKQVVNTNKCLVYPEKTGNKLVVHTAIDNLLKGASGQAVQNMNLMFGLEETCGLKLKANFF